MLYMYIGGGAVDDDQSFLIGGLVVVCKNWRWAALTHAASRLAGQACQNSLGPMSPELVLPENGRSKDTTTPEAAAFWEFHEYCNDVWNRLCEHCDHTFYDLISDERMDRGARSTQAEHTMNAIDKLLNTHRQGVRDLLNEAG